jgi:hypothetical protein
MYRGAQDVIDPMDTVNQQDTGIRHTGQEGILSSAYHNTTRYHPCSRPSARFSR